jgi:hypothetical protein
MLNFFEQGTVVEISGIAVLAAK